MPVLLQIDSSVDGARSHTRQLTAACAKAWTARGSAYTVAERDLHRNPPPVMRTSAQHWPERLRFGAELDDATVRAQAEAIDTLCAADAVVIGVPMYNYAMPATLKAWVDLIHVPGVTAPFDVETQPLNGRPVVLCGARGGTDDDGGFAHLLGSLALVLGEGLGMQVHTVLASRTLAHLVPALDQDRANVEFAAALSSVSDLASSL